MKRFLIIFVLLFFISGTMFYTGCKKSNSIQDYPLQGSKWILESIQYSNQNIVPVQELFYVLLKKNLTFEMQVDCNTCSGMYELGASNFIFFDREMICTDAWCGDNSKDTEFHAAIETATKYEVNENRLRIYFNNEQSYLIFLAEVSTF